MIGNSLIMVAAVAFVLGACTPTKPAVRMDAGATNHYSSGRILFSQPF